MPNSMKNRNVPTIGTKPKKPAPPTVKKEVKKEEDSDDDEPFFSFT